MLSYETIIGALERGAHFFVNFFIIVEQIIVYWISDRQQFYEKVLQK